MNLNDMIKVQTERGDVPIENVQIGDIVYEYNTGHPYEVLDVVEEDRMMYRAKYNDGRMMYYSEGELDVLRSITPSQECIRFGSRIANPLQTDPYTAGVFLVYGDRTDEYMNLPFDVSCVNSHFGNSYNIEFDNKVPENGKRYYRFKGSPEGSKIKWSEFFPNLTNGTIIDATIEPDATTLPSNGGSVNVDVNINYYGQNASTTLIPFEYQRARITDRMKFIRGVFDMGYDRITFPDDCGIAHWDKTFLEEVQKMLWSLGILSVIEYDEESASAYHPVITTSSSNLSSDGGSISVNIEYKPSAGKYWQLYVVGKSAVEPGLFYNVETIENMLDNKFRTLRYVKMKFRINSIKEIIQQKTPRLIFRKPYLLYNTDNFLPKIGGAK